MPIPANVNDDTLKSMLGDEALTEVVDDMKSQEAASINAGGVADQLAYLRDTLTPHALDMVLAEQLD